MSYKHLTIEERYQIQAYKEVGFTKNAIAKKLNVHPSTIGRELNRNSSKINKRYSAKNANKVSNAKRKYASQRSNLKMTTRVKGYSNQSAKQKEYSNELSSFMIARVHVLFNNYDRL